MSAPWMPLYVADYLADTAHLSAAEHGAYLLLIMHYWRAGKLPTDEKQLQRIARMNAREWANSRDTLASFFGGNWTHKRIENEIAKSVSKSNARAEAGSRGGNAKALKNNDAHVANATNLPEQNAALALASSSQSDKSSLRSDLERVQKPASPKPKKSFNPRKALADLGCEEKHITGWLEVRKAKRSPLTEAALDALKREADRANVPVAYAVQVCAAKGWQSFDATWKFERPPPDANATAGPKLVFVIEGSEQWQAWCDYRRRIGANRPFVTENRENGFKRGNWFPTEYPPKQEQAA